MKKSIGTFLCAWVLQTVFWPQPGKSQEIYNIPLVQVTGKQIAPRIQVLESRGENLIIWLDFRNGRGELFYQRLSVDGYPAFENGQQLFKRGASIRDFVIAGDKENGFYIVWQEAVNRGTRLYAWRMTAAGEPVWPAPLPIGPANALLINPHIVHDFAGGIYIVWEETPVPSAGDINLQFDIYAQHVDPGGNKLWDEEGVPVVEADGAQRLEDIEALPKALAVTWSDKNRVLMQLLDAKDGDPITDTPIMPTTLILGNQSRPRLAYRPSSSSPSVFIVWHELTTLRAQRISGKGRRIWGLAGREVVTYTGDIPNHVLMYDGKGGLIVTWEEVRTDQYATDIRAQRLDKNGRKLWDTRGEYVISFKGNQTNPAIAPDFNEGFFCIWEDTRNGQKDLYAQYMSRSGRRKWHDGGIPVSTYRGDQRNPQLIVFKKEKLLAVWEDSRDDNADIFAQYVFSDGVLDNVVPVIVSEPPTTATVGTVYEYLIDAVDIDRDMPLKYSVPKHPEWLSFDPDRRLLSGMVPDESGATYTVVIAVEDSRGAGVQQEYELTIIGENRPPKIVSQPDTLAKEDSPYVYQVKFEDPDRNDTHKLIVEQAPSWIEVDSEAFLLQGTPRNEDVGRHQVILIVQDQVGARDRQEFTIRVVNTNDPPVFWVSTLSDTAVEDENYRLSIKVEDPDVDDSIQLDFLVRPSWLFLQEAEFVLEGLPTNEQVGDTVAVLRALDQQEAADTLEIWLHVKNVNDPPEFISTPVNIAFVDSLYYYRVLVRDVDPGDTLTLRLNRAPTWLTLEKAQHILKGIPPSSAAGDSFKVELQVLDRAGARADQAFYLHVVDLAPDSIPPGPPLNLHLSPAGWTNRDTLILSWTPPADESGIAGVLVKFHQPPGNNQDYDIRSDLSSGTDSIALYLPFEGKGEIYCWLIDGAGNADYQTAQSISYKIDRTIPMPAHLIAPNEWSRGDTVVFQWLAARDTVSGIEKYVLELQPTQFRQTVPATQQDTVKLILPLNLGEKLMTWSVFAFDSAGNFVPSATLEFDVDNVKPIIIHTPVDTVYLDRPNVFAAQVRDRGSGIEQVILVYRNVGENVFKRRTMTVTASDQYETALTQVELSPNGLEYFILATDRAGNVRQWNYASSITGYRSPPVVSPGITFPGRTQKETYQMISIPFFTRQRDVRAFFESQLGPYDDTRWRLLRYQDSAYVEPGSGNLDKLWPGRAYWLITRDSRELSTGAITSVSLDTAFTILLKPGWNMVGSPFPVEVDLPLQALPPEVEPVFWKYTGNQYVAEQGSLKPWIGYFVKNNSPEPVQLSVSPHREGKSVQVSKTTNRRDTRKFQWLAEIEAVAGDMADRNNRIGVITRGEIFYLSEPPAIGKTPRLYFVETVSATGPLAHHYKRPDEPWQWKVVLDNLRPGTVTITLNLIIPGPDSLQFLLTDRKTRSRYRLQPGRPVVILVSEAEQEKVFDLLAVIRQTGNDPVGPPETMNLHPVWPNPLRLSRGDEAVFQFELNKSAPVSLKLYNILGQVVWEFHTGHRIAPGLHAVVWNGRTMWGRPAAPGIYILTLEGPFQPLTRKVLVLK